jgi:hypothetical protein
MELVVVITQNRPEQLRLLADGQPVQDRPSLSDLAHVTSEIDLLLGKLLKAIRTEGSLKEI